MSTLENVVAFEQLLVALHPDRERAGEQYSELHRQLVRFFEWQCGYRPDEQADRVLDLVIRKIAEGENIANLQVYAFGVARLLLREGRKLAAREQAAHEQLLSQIQHAEAVDPLEIGDAQGQQAGFERCLSSLSKENREIIIAYYTGEGASKIEARRRLAATLGTDLNALRVRAHRIRTQLVRCMSHCGPM